MKVDRSDMLLIVGAGLTTAGIWRWSTAAGLIAAGSWCIIMAIMAAMDKGD